MYLVEPYRRNIAYFVKNHHKKRNPFLPEWAKLPRKRSSEIATDVSAKSTARCAVGEYRRLIRRMRFRPSAARISPASSGADFAEEHREERNPWRRCAVGEAKKSGFPYGGNLMKKVRERRGRNQNWQPTPREMMCWPKVLSPSSWM